MDYFDSFIKPHIKDITKKYEAGEEISEILTHYGIDYQQFYERHLISDKSVILHDYNSIVAPVIGDVMQWLSMGLPLVDICFKLGIGIKEFYTYIDNIGEFRAICDDTGRLDKEGNITSSASTNALYESIIKDNWDVIRDDIVQGKPIEDICHMLHISTSNWYKLRKEHKDFDEMVENCDTAVLKMKLDDTMAKMATGFYYEEVKTTMSENLKTGEVTKRVEKTKKYSPPNTTALRDCYANIVKDDDFITTDRLSANVKRREIALKEANSW